MDRLRGKTCLITGAASGIGAAIARAFHGEGAQVVATDIDIEAGAALAAELGCSFSRLDVGEEGDWDRIATSWPEIDVLVNNAGITGLEDADGLHDPEHVSLAEWRRVHHVNLEGVMLGCRYGIGAMKRRGRGSIINMSSRSGLVGIPGAAAYASSKAAIRNHTKTVALYCAQQGWSIRCNSIHPAAIWTPIWEPMLGGPETSEADREARRRALVADIPARRFGSSDEVASVAVMLASDEAAYINGSELTIDGGILAGSAAAPGGD